VEPSNGQGLVLLVAAKIVCCGGLLLAAAGVISLAGIASWFLEGGYIWFVAAVLAIVAAYLWRQRARIDETGGGQAPDTNPGRSTLR
jgi:uncharacterized membrane protein YfcA